jgi:phosphate-selective porin OprO/OprP
MILPVNIPYRPAYRLLLLLLPGVLLWSALVHAQDETPVAMPARAAVVDPCPPVSEAGEKGSEKDESGEFQPGDHGCETTSSERLSRENRQEISEEVLENTQNALTLKRLLLGRSYTFFGKVEPEYAAYFDGILKDEDGFEIRRFSVGMVGVLTDTLSYKGEIDLTDGFNNISDLYLRWDSSRFGSLTIGNQKVAQNLSAMTGVLSLLFMERPLPVTTFSLARRLAIGQDLYFRKFGVHAVIFTKDPNNNAGKRGVAIRVIANPVRSDSGIAHVGFSFVREEMDRAARYRTRPESHVTDIRLVDTGLYDDIEYQNILGVEVAGARGALSGRIEAFASRWEREGSVENDFYGAYIEIGHFLTGQNFRYRDGKFVRPRIEKGSRAWEVGIRASWVDLNDQDIRGGIQKNLGLALNFYPRRNFRAMFNVIYYDAERDHGDEEGWIAQTRIQFNW